MTEMKLGPQLRTVAITRADSDEEDERRFDISFSSEEPFERWWGIEILGHKKGEVELDWMGSGRAPLLVDHRTGIDNQIGVVEKVKLDQGKGRATIRFGKGNRANEILERVRDGELSSISVGYRINKMRLEEEDEEKSTYRVTSWTPHEISLVTIPADPTVGFGRSDEVDPKSVEIEGTETMTDKSTPAIEPANPTPPAPPQPDPEALNREREESTRLERERIQEITAIGAKFNMRDKADKAVVDGLSVEQFRGLVLDDLGPKADDVLATKAAIGLTEKEIGKFSFVNVMRALANPNDVNAQKAVAFEREVCEAAARAYGKTPQGYFIPVDILRAPIGEHKRDLVVGTDTAGGHTVATDLLASSFIDLLRNRSVLMRLGVTTMMDLQGDIAIPRQTGGATAYWVAESGSPTESQQAFDQVPLTPKGLGAYTDMSRKLLIQSSIDVEAFVRRDLATVVALEIDRVGLYGSGASNQPRGVANQTGINTTTFAGADPTFEEVVAMESAVAADNADIGNLAYATDTNMRGAFKTAEKATGTAQFIWEPGNTVNGHRTEISNQIVDGDLFFGNWGDELIGMWTGIDMTVDPYTQATSGTVRIIALQDVDVAVRHPESFCHSNDGV